MLGCGLAQIVAAPEAAIEDLGKLRAQLLGRLGGVFARLDHTQCAVVALDNALDIFATARTTLDLQDTHAGIDKLIEEVDGTQILRREYPLTLGIELSARFAVGEGVAAAADLAARTTICRATRLVQTQVALARNSHTQRAVREHLDADLLARRTADIALLDGAVNRRHLIERELARQHRHIGPLRIELQRLAIRDVELGREVDLHAARTGIENHRLVGRDDCIDLRNGRTIDNGVHLLDLVVVDDRIDRQVGLDARLVSDLDNLIQIIESEVGRRGRAHIERTDAKVNRIGSRLDRRQQRLVRARRRHYFDIFTFDHRCFLNYFLRPIRLWANSRI